MVKISDDKEQSANYDYDNEMIEIFMEEAGDILMQLEDDLLNLEKDPGNLEIINSVFRAMHTIKGSAGLTGLMFISDFAHVLEDILDDLRKESLEIPESHMMVFLDSLDLFKSMLDNLGGEGLEEIIENAEEVKELLRHLMAMPMIPEMGITDITEEEVEPQDDNVPAGDENNEGEEQLFIIHMNFQHDLFSSGTDPLMLFLELEETGEIEHIQLNLTELPDLDKFDPYLLYINWKVKIRTVAYRQEIEDIFIFVAEDVVVEQLAGGSPGKETEEVLHKDVAESSGEETVKKDQPSSGPARAEEKEVSSAADLSESKRKDPADEGTKETAGTIADKIAGKKSAKTGASGKKSGKGGKPPSQEIRSIRVDTDKLENILNHVAELSIAQSRIKNIITTHLPKNSRNDEVEYVFEEINKITRLLQEEVMRASMVPIEGAFIRFQRMVRDLAKEKGKNIEVNVSGKDTELDRKVIEQITDPLKHMIRNSVDHGVETMAEREAAGKAPGGNIFLRAYHKEGGIVIEVEDDGKGLDVDAILSKAAERGLITEGQELRREEIMRLPFLPGFSTAKQISDISGQGVGLDVVKTNIEALRGHVDLETEKGKGTKFKISSPLTLAIIDAMMVTVGEDRLLVPLGNIVEFIKLSEKDVSKVAGKTPVIHFRGQYVPLVMVKNLLGIAGNANNVDEGMLVVVQDQRRPLALIVDEIVGQEQVVIKSIKENMEQVEGVAGATIMGDGRVAMILDIAAIIRMASLNDMVFN